MCNCEGVKIGVLAEPAFTISHVCQRWRIIAISYPPLWSNIIQRNQEAQKQCVERARTSPLDVTLGVQDDTLMQAWYALKQVRFLGNQVRSMNLEVARDLFESTVELLPASLPRLESLRLASARRHAFDLWSLTVEVDSDLWADGVPCLRSLELSNVLDCPRNLFVNLTSLSLIHTHLPVRILQHLENAPFLETLRIESILEVLWVPLALPSVELRALRTFDIIHSPHVLLHRLHIPNVTQLTVVNPMDKPDTDHFCPSPPDTETLQELHSIGVSVSAGGVALVIEGEGFGSSYSFREIHSSGASAEQQSCFIRDSFKLIASSGLRSLTSLSIRFGSLRQDLSLASESMYRGLPALETLEIVAPSWLPILHPLRSPELCTALRVIKIGASIFTYTNTFEVILELALSRAGSGHPLSQVELLPFPPDGHGDIMLRKLWDGLCEEEWIQDVLL